MTMWAQFGNRPAVMAPWYAEAASGRWTRGETSNLWVTRLIPYVWINVRRCPAFVCPFCKATTPITFTSEIGVIWTRVPFRRSHGFWWSSNLHQWAWTYQVRKEKEYIYHILIHVCNFTGGHRPGKAVGENRHGANDGVSLHYVEGQFPGRVRSLTQSGIAIEKWSSA